MRENFTSGFLQGFCTRRSPRSQPFGAVERRKAEPRRLRARQPPTWGPAFGARLPGPVALPFWQHRTEPFLRQVLAYFHQLPAGRTEAQTLRGRTSSLGSRDPGVKCPPRDPAGKGGEEGRGAGAGFSASSRRLPPAGWKPRGVWIFFRIIDGSSSPELSPARARRTALEFK